VVGRVNSILDLSMGFDPDATGFENIFLRGVMTGLRRREIMGRIDEIAEFSELGDYLSLPVRTYSSGMLLRLAFAISTCTEAEILLLDEWLTVGDALFSAKASQRLEEVANRAAIIVVASHDPLLIDRVCNRVLRLEHGIIAEDIVKRKAAGVQDPTQALEESL
jgi:lipopolysaccharide transport system ATP-binding protein